MAMTNAEKQAAWRQRRQDELERLRAQQPSRPQPQPAAPSPFADCTPEEVDMLRAVLTEWRDNEPQRRAEQARREAAPREYAEMRAQRAEEYAALSPAEKAMHDKEVADRRAAMEEAKKQYNERIDAVHRHKEQAKPKAGTYWVRQWLGGVERVTITVGPRGGIKAVNDAGYQLPLKYDTHAERWEINGERLFATKEEGERFYPPIKDNPLKDKTDKELRRIRSEHHPDKGNGHADPALYQQAVEELDRRRG